MRGLPGAQPSVLRGGARGKVIAMNRHEKPASAAEARVQYLDGEYRVLRPGMFVICAVTGQQIALEDLRYWSVDRQEAYVTPEASMQRILQNRPAG